MKAEVDSGHVSAGKYREQSWAVGLLSAGTCRKQRWAVGCECTYVQRAELAINCVSAGTCREKSCAVSMSPSACKEQSVTVGLFVQVHADRIIMQ